MNAKQRLFVAEYLKDLNATQAAIRCGYSEKTAHVQGVRLLKNANVRAAVDVAMATRVEEVKVDANFVLAQLAEIVQADVADLYNDDMTLKPVHEWPMIWRQGLVAGIDVEELFDGKGGDRSQIGVLRKIKLADRLRGLELLGKHVNVQAFQEVIQHNGQAGLGDRLDAIEERERQREREASKRNG